MKKKITKKTYKIVHCDKKQWGVDKYISHCKYGLLTLYTLCYIIKI